MNVIGKKLIEKNSINMNKEDFSSSLVKLYFQLKTSRLKKELGKQFNKRSFQYWLGKDNDYYTSL